MSKQYDVLYIQQYLEGKLSPQDMHQLEQEALNDAMLNDAIEGFRLSNSINHKRLSLLQQRLENRIESQHEEKNRFYFTGQRLAVASAAGVMMIVISVLFWMLNVKERAPLLPQDQQTEVLVQLKNQAHVSLISGSLIPQNGWKNYQDYLSVNGIQISAGEIIRLSFKVTEGRPQDIKVITATNSQVSQDLIELIEDGPSWNGISGEVEISF